MIFTLCFYCGARECQNSADVVFYFLVVRSDFDARIRAPDVHKRVYKRTI